jgi:hypothetical protein
VKYEVLTEDFLKTFLYMLVANIYTVSDVNLVPDIDLK